MSHHEEELCAALTRMALAGDGLVLGLGMAGLAVRTWLKFRSHSMAFKQIQETPVTRIADLRSLVQEKEERSHKESEKPIPESRVLTVSSEHLFAGKPAAQPVVKQEQKLVIVRGKVYPSTRVQNPGSRGESDALVAENGNEKGVFLERTQTCLYNEWRGILGWGCVWKGMLGWGLSKDQVTLSRRKVPFVIAGSEAHRDCPQSRVYVHIKLDDPPKHPLPLVTVYHKLYLVPTSSYTFFQAMLGRRYPVGLLDEEKILPIGKEITAVGIVSASSDGNPMIQACKHLPCFLSEGTRDQLVTELATGTRVIMWAGIAVSTVAVGILGYAFMKNWTKWKVRQRERQRQNEQTRQDRILVEYELEDITDVPDGELCVVCLLRRRRAAFIFCGHRVCCVSCAQRVEQGVNARCPVCRQSVTGHVQVFDS